MAGACGSRTAAAPRSSRARRSSPASRASRSGPKERIVTCSARRSPRRNGVSTIVTALRPPAGTSMRVRRGGRPRGRLPGVAQQPAHAPGAGVGDAEASSARSRPAARGRADPVRAAPAAGSRRSPGRRRRARRPEQPQPEHPGLAGYHDREHAERDEGDEETGDCHGLDRHAHLLDDRAQDRVGRDALELRLGPQLDAVPQHRQRHRLHVVGRDRRRRRSATPRPCSRPGARSPRAGSPRA